MTSRPFNYVELVQMVYLCPNIQFSPTRQALFQRPDQELTGEIVSTLLTALMGMTAQAAETSINSAPCYDVSGRNAYGTVLDNAIYAYISELENLSGHLVAKLTNRSFLAITGHSLVYITTGALLFPVKMTRLNTANMIGVWCIRRGIGSMGRQLTDSVKTLDVDESTLNYAASALLCTPAVMTLLLLPQYGTVVLLTDMGCAHGSAFLKESRVRHLVKQGHLPRRANAIFVGESFMSALLIIGLRKHIGSESVFILIFGNTVKVCADGVLTEIKEQVLPEQGAFRILAELATETSVIVIALTPALAVRNTLIKTFMKKIRDHAIYYETRRLTQYTIALINLILTNAAAQF